MGRCFTLAVLVALALVVATGCGGGLGGGGKPAIIQPVLELTIQKPDGSKTVRIGSDKGLVLSEHEDAGNAYGFKYPRCTINGVEQAMPTGVKPWVTIVDPNGDFVVVGDGVFKFMPVGGHTGSGPVFVSKFTGGGEMEVAEQYEYTYLNP